MTESGASFSETLTSLLITYLGTTEIRGEDIGDLSFTTWSSGRCEHAMKMKVKPWLTPELQEYHKSETWCVT